MPESLYPEVGSPKPTGEGPPPEDQEQDSGETALIPKSLLGGKEWKPGDEIVFTIVRLHDDEAEIRYSTDKPEESESEDEPESADSEIDRMSMMGSKKGY